MTSRRFAIRSCSVALAFAAALLVASGTRADEVQTKDGKTLTGKITEDGEKTTTILTYKDGPVTVAAEDLKSKKKKPSFYDAYDKKAAESEDTAEGHYALGKWCELKTLTWQARAEWEKAVSLDPSHEKAHKALGHEKVDGTWKTHEEVMKAKGLVLLDGKWIDAKKADEIKRSRKGCVAHVFTAACVGFEGSHAFLESWGKRAVEASKYMWRLTEGQMYVKQMTIFPKKEAGQKYDFEIVNQDSMKIRQGVYAQAYPGDHIDAPGQILAYTFFHEMIHYKFKRSDHCDNCHHCIMSSDPNADAICDDKDHKAPPVQSCWGEIRAFYEKQEIFLKPLERKTPEKLPPDLPETIVIVK
ncbi:hypothetical protein HY251_21795 [bacterium]|nr:hypothetical protein [bacterium]